MKTTWFKKIGWAYLPVHPMGMLVTMAAILFLVTVGLSIFREGHSGSDDLFEVFMYGTCTAFWWKWIAEKTSD